ncbi:MAG: hypothetical protein KDA93_18110 [Planctomycetaceae bacterium]|nr:hypothetical protein [Planctomycetaceae bacterium]
MSVFAHGITAVPASKWYADRTQAAESIVYLAEHKQIKELPFCCWMSAEDSPDQEVSPT